MNIECNNCDVLFSEHYQRSIKLVFPEGYADTLKMLCDGLDKKRVHQVYVKLGYPRKPRTTGEKSQNHHLNGHIQQICAYTGDDFDDVKMHIKRKAMAKGYPFHTDSFGNAIPDSESDATTGQCAWLIDTAHEVAAFLNVKLKEI